jgi:hypothetical protein
VYSRFPGADVAFHKFLATGEAGIWRWTPLQSVSSRASLRRNLEWMSADLSESPGIQTGEFRIRLLVLGAAGELRAVF